jgi:hypothetical protein
MAPGEMAWQGKSLAQICEQIKDPQHNGGWMSRTFPRWLHRLVRLSAA